MAGPPQSSLYLTPFLWITPWAPAEAEPYARAGFLPEFCSPADLDARLRQPFARELPAAIFIGDVHHPVSTARAAHLLSPESPIVFLVTLPHQAALRKQLSLVSLVGTYWIADPGDIDSQLRILEDCRSSRARRQRLRTTLDRFKLRLSASRVEDASRFRRLVLSDRYLASLLDQAQDAILSLDSRDAVATWNKGAESLFGWKTSEILGRPFAELASPADRSRMEQLLAVRRVHAAAPVTVELNFIRRDGSSFPGEFSLGHILDEESRLLGKSVILRDFSVRKRLEADLMQSQKMEAVGQLAGGIAHDFNNLLTAINGYAEMVRQQLPAGDPLWPMVDEICKSGERAANLTGQLLQYSRRQSMRTQLLDLNAVVSDMNNLLRRLIGAHIQFEVVLEPRLAKVRADRVRLEQILMNLVLNARDAMPQQGRLTVETGNASLERADGDSLQDSQPESHVVLVVRDTGIGMTPEVKARLFDPFFTTKPVGKGTGLGLSSVYGAVQQFGGVIRVDSEPGKGSRFEVFLPAARPAEADPAMELPGPAQSRPSPAAPGKAVRVLLVEDEASVLRFASQVLREAGFQVETASEGKAALALLDTRAKSVDLLVTDIVMPGMNGLQLASAVAERHPQVKVLYMSGYAEDAIKQHGAMGQSLEYLQKPFTRAQLLKGIVSAMEA